MVAKVVDCIIGIVKVCRIFATGLEGSIWRKYRILVYFCVKNSWCV